MKIDDLFKINTELGYICGAEGNNHIIKYVDVIEIPEGCYWIKEGDFIITTGYFLKNNDSVFLKFISTLIEKKASCLGIKLGKYINTIPEKIMKLSEKNNFPLISIPLNLSYREVSKPILRFISHENGYLEEQFQYSSVEMFYLNLISQTDFQVSRLLENAKQLVINYYSNRCLCILRYQSTFDEKNFALFNNQLKRQFASNNIVCIHQPDFKKIICVFDFNLTHLCPKNISSFFEELYQLSSALMLKNRPLYLGVSDCFKTLNQMNTAYKNADCSLRIGRIIQKQCHLFFYSDYIVYDLLYDNLEHDSMLAIYQNFILKLIQYDKQNKTDFYQTLESLEKHGFNMNKTSDSLFIHRNTLYKRIEKISQILNCDLEDPQTKLILSLSLKYSKLIAQ